MQLGRLLSEGFGIEAAGWKGAAGTAIISSQRTEGFYRSVAEWALARGFLRLAFLRLDDRAIAFDFALESGGVHYFLKTGYDPTMSDSAPGLILRRDMIVRAFHLGLTSYELLGGSESWKLAWTATTRSRHRLMVFGHSPLGFFDHLAQSYARPAAKAGVESWHRRVANVRSKSGKGQRSSKAR